MAEAIENKKILEARRKAEQEAYWNSLSPEERARKNRAGLLFAQLSNLGILR